MGQSLKILKHKVFAYSRMPACCTVRPFLEKICYLHTGNKSGYKVSLHEISVKVKRWGSVAIKAIEKRR